MRQVHILALLTGLASCTGEPAPHLEFRAQCAASEPGASAVEIQGQRVWFGPARQFALDAAVAVTDAQGHPAITLILDPAERAQFEAFTTVTVEGPLGIFLGGELIAAPAVQSVTTGRFTFCNEAGGWTPADRDRWIGRIKEGFAP